MDLFNVKVVEQLRRENVRLDSANKVLRIDVERLRAALPKVASLDTTGRLDPSLMPRSTHPETLAGSAGNTKTFTSNEPGLRSLPRSAPKTAAEHRERAAELIERAFSRNPFYGDERTHRDRTLGLAEQHIRAAKALDILSDAAKGNR